MRSVKVLSTLLVVALVVTLTSCGAGISAPPSPSTPRGSTSTGALTLSGAITATVTAGSQDARAGCRTISQAPLPPATNITTFLTGEVDFGSGADAVVLSFQGVAGSTHLPLPGDSVPGAVEIISAGTADWYAGQSSQTSSGTLTLSGSGSGTIHGAVDASLAPLRGSSAQLHVAGSWSC